MSGLAAVVPGRAAEPARKAGSPQPIRLGGPMFNAPADPDELALAHRRLGYRAAYCPGVSLSEPDRVRAFRDAFARHGVVIAEVGRWVNLLDADILRIFLEAKIYERTLVHGRVP